jgi:hypothetical protein
MKKVTASDRFSVHWRVLVVVGVFVCLSESGKIVGLFAQPHTQARREKRGRGGCKCGCLFLSVSGVSDVCLSFLLLVASLCSLFFLWTCFSGDECSHSLILFKTTDRDKILKHSQEHTHTAKYNMASFFHIPQKRRGMAAFYPPTTFRPTHIPS